MRNPVQLLAALAVTALVAGACSGNDPQPPLLVQAGWSWNPGVAGDRPLPVIWRGTAAPVQLPLLPGGDCGASGSVQALTVLDGNPYAVGISVSCSGGTPTMSPVAWQDGTVTRLPLPGPATQGSALAATVGGGHVYVAGATGDALPLPTIWKDGVIGTTRPGVLLPPWADSGVITSLVVTEKYAIAAGIIHVLGSTPPLFQGLVWVLDPDFTSVDGTLLPPPAGMSAATFGGSVTADFDGQTLFSAAALSLDGREKPVVWLDDVGSPILGTDFATGPWGVPTGIRLVELTPYLSGYFRSGGPGTPPQPAIWTAAAAEQLSTADESSRIGAGEGLAIAFSWAYVVGETLARDPTDAERTVSVPACWTNGQRQDLAPLVAAGGGPLVAQPLYGWWRIPGADPAAAPGWPYPGGFGEVFRARPVAAAGSGVVRAVVTIP